VTLVPQEISNVNDEGRNETGFRGFAKFLRGYMGVMPLVTAAFAPLLTLAHAIPLYAQQRTSLACISGLLGFLAVAWVFYARHSLAAALFYDEIPQIMVPLINSRTLRVVRSTMLMFTPLALILLSVLCFFRYNMDLEHSVAMAQGREVYRASGATSPPPDFAAYALNIPHAQLPSRAAILAQLDYPIDLSYWLEFYYLGIFLCAELAFVMMATREYLQGVLGLSDLQIIWRQQGSDAKRAAEKPAVKSVADPPAR
jgi:hypothetical protein